jgi:hypothetical protein
MILGVRDHLELLEPGAWKREQERIQPETAEIWRRARQAMEAARRTQVDK